MEKNSIIVLGWKSFENYLMNFELLQADSFGWLAQEIGEFVNAVVEERHLDSELAEKLFFVELDAELGVADYQVVIVVHEWAGSLAFAEGVEVAFIEVEDEGSFLLFVQLFDKRMLRV